MALDDFTLDVGSDALDEARLWLTTKLTERFPDIDWTGGAAHGLVVLPLATVMAAVSARITTIRNAHNLSYMLGGEADDDEITEFLTNYRITRREAAVASGTIRLVVNSNAPLVITAGTRFRTDNGIYVFVIRDVRGVPNPPTGENEQQFKQYGNKWYLILDASAELPGVVGNLTAGTKLTPEDTIAGFVAAAVDRAFSGGADAETPKELASRILSGISAGTFSSPVQMLSLIRSAATNGLAHPALADTYSAKVVGSGFPEMMRDKRGLFPVSVGGRVDVYVKTTALPSILVHPVTATLIGRTAVAGDGIWRFTLGRDVAPGFYRVQKVVQRGDVVGESYEITGDVRGYDVTADGRYIPDIQHAYEARYSPFQTAVITFVDTDTIVEDGDIDNKTGNYDAYILYMPHIADVQAFLSSDVVRPPGLDVLVRAPTPMFVSVTVTLSAAPTDVGALISSIVSFISTCPIGYELSEAEVAGVAASALPPATRIVSVSLSGKILDVTGNTIVVETEEDGKLAIPDEPSVGVTKNTVGLITAASDVSIAW